jgi:hypothetical protein
MEMEADDIIAILGLRSHPEGGHFIETWRESAPDGGRGASTAIYFLLKAGETSAWHRVDATEIWHWHAGAPLRLSLADDAGHQSEITLGSRLLAGERPQGVVPAGQWQSATSLGAWTLVGCTVAPAFQFSGFEMAPPGWTPR